MLGYYKSNSPVIFIMPNEFNKLVRSRMRIVKMNESKSKLVVRTNQSLVDVECYKDYISPEYLLK
jgi:hypothetical protein